MTDTVIPKFSTSSLKCHVGPGCRLHSPTGIASARKALRQATEAVQNSTTLEDMYDAKGSMVAAQALYDMTAEGQNNLTQAIQDETNPVDNVILSARLKTAQEGALEAEEGFRKDFEATKQPDELVSTINMLNTSTYDVPVSHTTEGAYPATVGSKHASEWMSATNIAKNVRNDLKEAQKAGYIPADLTYSVTKETYSGGQSISVSIRGLKDEAIYSDIKYRFNPTSRAKELEKRVEGIANAYNSQVIMGQIDYFNVLYWSRTQIEDEKRREYRIMENGRKKRMIEGNNSRKSFKNDVSSLGVKGFLHNNKVSFTNVGKDGTQFQRVGDSNVFAFKSIHPLNKTEMVELYDFSSVTPGSGNTFESLFEESKSLTVLLSKRKKNRFLRSEIK